MQYEKIASTKHPFASTHVETDGSRFVEVWFCWIEGDASLFFIFPTSSIEKSYERTRGITVQFENVLAMDDDEMRKNF
jgi:hypothetical protein